PFKEKKKRLYSTNSIFQFIKNLIKKFINPSIFRLKKNKKIRQRGFQETDVESIFESVTKYVKLIKDPLMIRYELEKAIYFATEKRPGPVVLDIPDDLQRVEIDPTKLASFTPPKEEKTFSDEEIKKMYEMITLSKRPVILFGAGVHIAKCEDKAIEFAKKLKIPVLLTWAAKDLLSEEDELNMGVFGVCGPRYSNFAVQNSDLVIAMGIRLCQMNTGGKQNLFAPKAQKIMIDVDEEGKEKYRAQVLGRYTTHRGESRVRLYSGAGMGAAVEEFVHHIQKTIQRGGPEALRGKIKSWEEGVREQAKEQGINIPLGPETFAKAYLGYLGWEPNLSKFYKLPSDII
ncbi:hypothetical protein LCGC14_3107200, partial [marine sediment metagenome]